MNPTPIRITIEGPDRHLVHKTTVGLAIGKALAELGAEVALFHPDHCDPMDRTTEKLVAALADGSLADEAHLRTTRVLIQVVDEEERRITRDPNRVARLVEPFYARASKLVQAWRGAWVSAEGVPPAAELAKVGDGPDDIPF